MGLVPEPVTAVAGAGTRLGSIKKVLESCAIAGRSIVAVLVTRRTGGFKRREKVDYEQCLVE